MAHHNIVFTNPHFRTLSHTGVSKSMLRYVIQNDFAISNSLIKECLSEYRLLYADSDYFFPQIREGLYRGYQVIYKDSLTNLKTQTQVALSFRNALSGYGLEKYVLVRKGNR